MYRLRFGMFLLLSVGISAPAFAPNAPEDEILIGGNFKVDIQGAGSCDDIVSVDVDPIEIEMHDVTQSNDSQWRTFRPGQARFGAARFTFRVQDSQCNDDLRNWMRELIRDGDKVRKSISIVLLDRHGEPARSYSLNDTYPIALAPSGSRHLTNAACPKCQSIEGLSELTVQIGSIDIFEREPSGAAPKDRVLHNKGFTVEIKAVDGSAVEVDSSWLSVQGGAAEIETVEATVGNDGERRFTPGKAYVSDLTLTGYMTPSRKALLRWMQNSAKGSGDLRRNVVISVEGPRPIDPRPEHQYYECLISRIRIPSLSAGSSEPIQEVVVIKPTRYNDP